MENKLKDISDLIKFEHTIFALPFGISAFLLLEKSFDIKKFVLIIIAIIFARTAGMAFNRLSDIDLDEKNPRTRNWPHVTGRVSLLELKLLIFLSSWAFVIISLALGLLPFLLSPFIIFLLWLYPKAKRFTYMPHIFLGLVYFFIPVGIDVALNNKISVESILLGIGMCFWVAGFDILYSLQDYEFDLQNNVKSIAVALGKKKAINISRKFHMITFLSLLVLKLLDNRLGLIYIFGLLLIALFLIYEHSLIKENDLSKLNKAFFTVNGYISIAFMILIIISLI